MNLYIKNDVYVVAVQTKETTRFECFFKSYHAGYCSVTYLPGNHGVGLSHDLLVFEKFRGKDGVTAAFREAMYEHCRQVLRLNSLIATVRQDNKAELASAKRAGWYITTEVKGSQNPCYFIRKDL